MLCTKNMDSDHPKILLCKPRIRTQSSRIVEPNLGHPWQQTHDQSRKQSTSAIRSNEDTMGHESKAAWPSAAKMPRSIAHAKQLGHSQDDRGIVACRAGMCALSVYLSVCCCGWLSCLACTISWLLCHRWQNCFACAIDCGFIDVDGQATLRP